MLLYIYTERSVLIIYNMNGCDTLPNIPDAKNRILDAAKKVFADKTYDGSRINDISELANVPKSLIYYHFKSKDDILDTLITDFLNEYKLLLQIAEDDTHEEKANRMTDRLKNHYFDFAVKNIDVVRIMFVESLKKSNETPSIFKVAEEIVSTETNNKDVDVNERLIAEFFSGVIPLYSYLCFYDKWCGYFNIDRTEFDRLFLGHFTETHGNYHKNNKNNKN